MAATAGVAARGSRCGARSWRDDDDAGCNQCSNSTSRNSSTSSASTSSSTSTSTSSNAEGVLRRRVLQERKGKKPQVQHAQQETVLHRGLCHHGAGARSVQKARRVRDLGCRRRERAPSAAEQQHRSSSAFRRSGQQRSTARQRGSRGAASTPAPTPAHIRCSTISTATLALQHKWLSK